MDWNLRSSDPIRRSLVDLHILHEDGEGVTAPTFGPKYQPLHFEVQEEAEAVAAALVGHFRFITGSFNSTEGAEVKNAENLLILDFAALAGTYPKNLEPCSGEKLSMMRDSKA